MQNLFSEIEGRGYAVAQRAAKGEKYVDWIFYYYFIFELSGTPCRPENVKRMQAEKTFKNVVSWFILFYFL